MEFGGGGSTGRDVRENIARRDLPSRLHQDRLQECYRPGSVSNTRSRVRGSHILGSISDDGAGSLQGELVPYRRGILLPQEPHLPHPDQHFPHSPPNLRTNPRLLSLLLLPPATPSSPNPTLTSTARRNSSEATPTSSTSSPTSIIATSRSSAALFNQDAESDSRCRGTDESCWRLSAFSLWMKERVAYLEGKRTEPTNWSVEAVMRSTCFGCESRRMDGGEGGELAVDPIEALIACDLKEVREVLVRLGFDLVEFLQTRPLEPIDPRSVETFLRSSSPAHTVVEMEVEEVEVERDASFVSRSPTINPSENGYHMSYENGKFPAGFEEHDLLLSSYHWHEDLTLGEGAV